ncbi:hypothetical protein QC760_010491 [Botrytis cinerea]
MPQENLGEVFSNLPPSTLANFAAFLPPPGVTANWENPDSHREILILIPTIMMFLMVICIIVRAWVVFWIMRPVKLRWSDLTFTLTVLVAITLYVVVLLSATGNGTFGLHNWDFSVARLISYRNLITTGLLPWLTPLTLGLVKVTIFLTYMEIFRSMKWMKMACLIGLTFTVVWYFSITIAQLCLAVPLGGEGWVKHLFTQRMIQQNLLSVPTAVVGLAIDCYLFILPIIALNKLKMTRRKKLGAGLIFATGFLAIVASILSVVYRVIHGDEHGDNTWWLVPIMAVTITETFIGFIIACAWHFSKFLRTYEQYFLRASSLLANLFCCKRKGSRGKESADPKSSEASDTVDDSKVSREKVKPPQKMYPGLDLTSRGGTVPATELDKIENIPNSRENQS